jgi:hypothetical protein
LFSLLLLLLLLLSPSRLQQSTLLSRLFGPRGGKLDDITAVVGVVA